MVGAKQRPTTVPNDFLFMKKTEWKDAIHGC